MLYIGIAMFDESTKLCDLKYKVVFLGHSAVGKSALIQRFIYTNFDPNQNVPSPPSRKPSESTSS